MSAHVGTLESVTQFDIPSDPTARRLPGIFIALEGGDGAGKSTQSEALAAHVQARGFEAVRTREPGGTEISEKLRGLVLEHGHGEIDARTEALIFAAARAAHVEQLVLPALAEGRVVITDRYVDSSIAYQGVGRELGVAPVTLINDFATAGLRPDLTVLLDVPLEVAKARRRSLHSADDRLESEADSFHENIREAFLRIAESHPASYVVIDAGKTPEEISVVIARRVDELLNSRERV